jgi:hypothetical protein
MQICARPCLLSEPALGFGAQLAKSRARSSCTIIVCGKIGQVFANESVHRGITLGSNSSGADQDFVIDA